MKKFIVIFILALCVLFLTAATPSCGSKKDGGIFKSVDGGENFEQKNKIDEKKNIGREDIFTIAINQFNSNTTYIGTKGNGIYKSTDAAETWFQVLGEEAIIYEIAIDPKTPSIIYAASFQGNNGKVYKSTNEGQDWEEIYIESEAKDAVTSIAVDSYDTKKLYAATLGGDLYKSEDYGETWYVLKWFEENAEINKIEIDPFDTRIVFVATNKGVFRTVDGGKTWKTINKGFKEDEGWRSGSLTVSDVTVDPNNKKIIYATTERGLFKSVNQGNNWDLVKTLIEPNTIPISSMAIDPSDSKKIYVSADASVHVTDDSGQNWAIEQLDTKREISIIKVDPNDSKNIYVGVKSEDKSFLKQ